MASRQVIAHVWRAIEGLPTLQKEMLILHDGQGIPTKAVCQPLKTSESNSSVRLHQARERVKVAAIASMGDGSDVNLP